VKVLLTGAASQLGRAVTEPLRRQRHRLRLTDRRRLRTRHEFVQSQLGHGRQTDDLVAGVKAIVHIPGPADPAAADAAAWIDACTRCTYNLLVAAVGGGVEHLVYVGSLNSFVGYDADFLVSSSWRPRPTTEPAVMAPHLGEFVAREFAQTSQIRLTILRLGHLVDADGIGPQDELDPLAIDPRDAAAGIAAALVEGKEPDAYRVFHLQGDFAGARFPVGGSRRRLDVELRHDFGRPCRGEAQA
jgi:nucleoside-diphosphate-sugar epimerase